MFNAYELLDIREQNLKPIIDCDALPKGFQLKSGTYEIICLEDSCDSAFIYQAINLKTKKFVTIKEFFPKTIMKKNYNQFYSRNPGTFTIELNEKSEANAIYLSELNRCFVEDAKFLEKISNRFSIINAIETFKELGTSYIVLKYNVWPSLNGFLESKYVFNENEINWIVKSLINIVGKLHKKDVIHQSINPKNIYFRDNEILIDGYGTNDYLRDLRIYDSEAYKNNYYGPEVLIHDGIISTWTDVYSIGKIIIDLISSMGENNDYFSGLENIESIQTRERYRICVERSITYNAGDRISDTIEMKKILFGDSKSTMIQRTSKYFVALTALLALIGSVFVLSEQKQTDTSGDYMTIEDTPLVTPQVNVDVDSYFYFITESAKSFRVNEPSVVKWEISNSCAAEYIYVRDVEEGDIMVVELDPKQRNIDVNSYAEKPGIYEISLFYTLNGEIENKKLIVKFEE